jgi:hypothetical protein
MSYTPPLSPIYPPLDEEDTLSEIDLQTVSTDGTNSYPFYLKSLSIDELELEVQQMKGLQERLEKQIQMAEKELEDRLLPLEERLKRLSFPELEAILDEKYELRKTLEGEEREAVEDWIIAAIQEAKRRRTG